MNRKLRYVLVFLAVLFAGLSATTAAAPPDEAGNVIIPAGEIVTDDYFNGGNIITNRGTVQGDFAVAGNQLSNEGTITGDFLGGGQTIFHSGVVEGNMRVGGRFVSVTGKVGKNLWAFGQEIFMEKSAAVGGNSLIAGENVTVNGMVQGNLRVYAETLVISGEINGDVYAEVDSLTLSPGAKVGGRLVYQSPKEGQISPQALVKEMEFRPQLPEPKRKAGPEVLSWIKSFLSLLAAAMLVLWLFPRPVSSVSRQMVTRPWVSLGIGLLAMILFLPLFIILLLTKIGTPLAFLWLFMFTALLAVLFYLSKLFLGLFIGEKILQAILHRDNVSAYASLAVGALLLFIAGKLPYIGFVVNAVLLFLSFGAGLTLLWNAARDRGKVSQDHVADTPVLGDNA